MPLKIHGHKLALRLAVWIAGCSILIFSVAVYLDYQLSRTHIVEKSELQATQIVSSAVSDLTAELAGVQRSTDLFAQVLDATRPPRDAATRLLEHLVATRDDIYGATIALEPKPDQPNGFAPYYFHSGKEVRYADLADPAYRYPTKAWYTEPRRQRRAVWSEPYYDEGGGDALMTTYSVPLFQSPVDPNEFSGVVTADITLVRLQTYLSRIRLGSSGYAALMSRDGLFLSHPIFSLVMQPMSAAYPKLAADPAWQDALARALRGETGAARVPCPHTSGPCLFAYSPLGDTGWPITVIYPEHEMLSDLREHSSKVAWISVIGILSLVLAVAVVSRTITQPLVALADASERLGGGDLDVALPPAKSNDEVGSLIRSFQLMQTRLKGFIARVEQETATRNRLQGELDAAHQIQMEMLPQQGEAFLEGPGYSIWARLLPAKAVGGDLYTWLSVDRRSLLMVVGDVSDKGVPAALFMARTITLLQEYAIKSQEPGDILRRLNHSLAEHNDTCMFATLFCGLLDTETGVLSFASGGHTAPMLVRGGKAAPLPQDHGPALGLAEDATYPANQVQLLEGDVLVVYTDGIDEAFNPRQELFGHERLAEALVQEADRGISLTGEAVLHAVRKFAAGTPQSDDITMLLLGWHGVPSILADLRPIASTVCAFPLRLSELEELFAWMDAWLVAHKLGTAELIQDLRLVAEEIFLNIVNYSGLSGSDTARVVMAHDGARIGMEFVDRGIPWNPLEQAPEVELGLSTEDAAIGGLGVFLVHELTDERLYRRDDGANRFCVLKNLSHLPKGRHA